MGVRYCTREQVKAALDVADTARSDAQIDRLTDAAARAVEALCHRRFYPELDTRTFDWPSDQAGTSWRLWLDQHEVLAVGLLTSAGVTVTDYFLEPQASGPPYSRIELDLAGPGVFGGGPTHQRDISVTGTFGYCDEREPAGELASGITSSATSLTVTAAAALGVGDLLLIDAERMQVAGRGWVASGQTLAGPLTTAKNEVVVPLADTAGFSAGESILVDGETMLVVDVAGATLVVRRGWNGSTLAPHSTDATVYASRRLTVARAQLGTTANAHTGETAIWRHIPPPLVQDLAIAETLVALGREQSGYARTIGTGDATRAAPGGDLRDLREQVYTAHGRKARMRAV